MQRDWDLVRKALLELEQAGEEPLRVEDRQMMYTYQILEDGGFVVLKPGPVLGNGRMMFVLAMRLTYDGHDFLNTIREEDSWEKVKNSFSGKMITFSGELLKEAVKVATEIGLKSLMGGQP